MKELLEQAISELGFLRLVRNREFSCVRDLDATIAALRKLAETAELRDEAWAAMRAYHNARAAYDNCDDPDEWGALFAAQRVCEESLLTLCRKVAETERSEP